MKDFLSKVPSTGESVIYYLYHREEDQMPATYMDPLELLGDISLLALSDVQKEDLRNILRNEIQEEGAEAVWQGRTLRKNLIHSFGRVF